MDPRRETILLRHKGSPDFEESTSKVQKYGPTSGGKVAVTYRNGTTYSFNPENVRVLPCTNRVVPDERSRIQVDGVVWNGAAELVDFGGEFARVFYAKQGGEGYSTFPASQVRVLRCPPLPESAGAVRRYWDAVVRDLKADDPLRRPYSDLDFTRPDTALHAYLTAAPIRQRDPGPLIFPFRCNLSQRQAVDQALKHSLSVIEGPPGTGKTETILNVIANALVRGETVGVVSQTNAAVENVREKLAEVGFGHVPATLGNRDKQERFFDSQPERERRLAEFLDAAPEEADLRRLATVDSRLRVLQRTERDRAEARNQVAAYRLELRHFEQHLQREALPDLGDLPLLRRSSERILDYLAETELERHGSRPGLLHRIRKYFKYGSLRGIDPADTEVVVRLQRAYYDKRIAELDKRISACERILDEERKFKPLAEEHRQLSLQHLRHVLGTRYRGRSRKRFERDTFKQGRNFQEFLREYPVVLSTCHSLASSIASGVLLDHLVIDEASQVDPLVAALAMGCSRNVVVVGDGKQLAPVEAASAGTHEPPNPAYDCRKSLLASVHEIYGAALPTTLLREHYRCEPAIIEFCNKKFYDDDLIPYRPADSEQPMLVHRTAEGNHMRRHHERGRFNQRELDTIKAEVLPQHCSGTPAEDIGITTPYRLQADKGDDLLDRSEVDTVHRFQGRQKRIVVFSTVLDVTKDGNTGLKFADEPRLINVAVSRAIEKFVLVTHHSMLPRSRHVRDLVGYIRYRELGGGVEDSAVLSIFDLLYQDFSKRLRALDRRITKRGAHRSENIAWTVLDEILAEEPYRHLRIAPQVLLRQLFAQTDELTPRQRDYMSNRASVDFVVYNRVTNEPVLAIEVDGFAYHENNPAQLERDGVKDSLFQHHGLPLLRLPTTGSAEPRRIRNALDAAQARKVQAPRPASRAR